MTTLLYVAAFLTVAIGLAHSILGERYILRRLRVETLPPLFGGPEFTAGTLRFAWHLTTLVWWGIAALLILLAHDALTFRRAAMVLAVTFLSSFAGTLFVSRGRHLAWIAFLAIGAICLYASVKT